jgi:hypothetical protein
MNKVQWLASLVIFNERTWSRIVLEKLTVVHLVKNCIALYGTEKKILA